MNPVTARLAGGALVLHDLEPTPEHMADAVLRGLTAAQKTLPCKFLYDEEGARLFDEICSLAAYYPTRTEIGILQERAPEIAAAVGPRARVVELGSGSGLKTRLLLRALEEPAAYVPVDISRAQLVEVSIALADAFPGLEISPVCADYTAELDLPASERAPLRTVAFFPGSTIGNFEPDEAVAFLRRLGELCGTGGGLVIGVDLQKEIPVLELAYNDPEAVTAAFNLNLLRRLNRECGTDFDLSAFAHRAVYDSVHHRIEMRLLSRRSQVVRVPDPATGREAAIPFRCGEAIVTEHSYKYTPEGFGRLAARAGFAVDRCWTDARGWFSVQSLRYLGPGPHTISSAVR